MEVSRNKSDFKLYGQQVGKLVRRSHAGFLNLLISMMGKPEKGLVELNNLFTGFFPPPPQYNIAATSVPIPRHA